MNFDLHLYGETPAELLEVLSHLGHMDSNYHTPIPDERHPAQAPAPQAQSEPVTQPDKPKAPAAPAKQKKAAQKSAAAPAEEPANPTTSESKSTGTSGITPGGGRVSPTSAPAQNAGAVATTDAPAAESPEKESETPTTPAGVTAPASDPAALDKIRDLARSLIVHGKRAEVQQIIKGTGAASISKLPSDSYADVWEQLVNLSKEVDNNATG